MYACLSVSLQVIKIIVSRRDFFWGVLKFLEFRGKTSFFENNYKKSLQKESKSLICAACFEIEFVSLVLRFKRDIEARNKLPKRSCKGFLFHYNLPPDLSSGLNRYLTK